MSAAHEIFRASGNAVRSGFRPKKIPILSGLLENAPNLHTLHTGFVLRHLIDIAHTYWLEFCILDKLRNSKW